MSKQLSFRVEVLRGVLLLLNVLFVLGGIALIGVGIYIKIDNNFSAILNNLANVSTFEAQSLGFLAFVLIGGGIFTVIIAVIGCMGSLWHKRYLLYIYAIILGILMILELVGLIMALVYKGKLEDVYKGSLSKVLKNALNVTDTKVLDAFYDLEKSLKCCGVNGLQDYFGFEPKNPDCYRYMNGCSGAIIELLKKNLPIIGSTLGVVLFFELLGLIGAIVLAIALNNAPDAFFSSNPGEVIKNIVPTRRRQNYDQF